MDGTHSVLGATDSIRGHGGHGEYISEGEVSAPDRGRTRPRERFFCQCNRGSRRRDLMWRPIRLLLQEIRLLVRMKQFVLR